ncbi:MAG: methyltransferase, partial [Pseudomonadota bacterium]
MTTDPATAETLAASAPNVTEDAFLGGRLMITQPRQGYRAALDAVCLAAALPRALTGKVIDVGAGVGVAGLCAVRQVPGITLTALERVPDLAALARSNAAANSLTERFEAVTGDHWQFEAPGRFDAALSNPPFYDASSVTHPPDQAKAQAFVLQGGSLGDWCVKTLSYLRARGLGVFVLPAGKVPEVLAALEPHAGALTIYPLWPGPGRAAKRVILGAVKAARGPAHLAPGLLLHDPPRRYSEAAEAVLRDG